MPSLKDLRGRIKSVKNTQQITKTMKMVAAAKVRRARNACDSARPYAHTLHAVLTNLAATAGAGGPLLLAGRDKVEIVRLLVAGADRGLCGGFNANLNKAVLSRIAEHESKGRTVEVIGLGRKVQDLLKITNKRNLLDCRVDVTRNITFELAEEIAQETVADFTAGKCDMVEVLYVECVSMLTQAPRVQQLIPFKAEASEVAPASYEFEPDEEAILAELLPRNVKTQIFQAMLDSSASEQAARMTAMDNATRNAGEMIKDLSLEYNRSRQATITKELIEIISGAQAV